MNLEGKLGETLNGASMKSGMIQLLPGIHPCDGFFIAAFPEKIRIMEKTDIKS